MNGAEKGFEITLDEDRGTAAGLLEGTVPATFTREEVTYRNSLGGVVFITQKIDRRTLELTSESTVKGGTAETKRGTCAIIEPTQNKF